MYGRRVSRSSDVLDEAGIDVLRTRIAEEVDSGRLPGCSFAYAHDGEVILAEAFGDATTESRFHVFSSTKPIVASLVWQALAEGLLNLEDKIVDHIPEFGSNGKDVITLEQVLLHTSGFPHAPLGPPNWSDRDAWVVSFAKWRLNWEPGTAMEYHSTSAHWVLAELCARAFGNDHRDLVEERVTKPLGLPRLLGLDAANRAADPPMPLEVTGEPVTAEELAEAGIKALPVNEVTDEALMGFNDPAADEVGVPGGGGVMTPSTMTRFYQGLLHNPGGLWDSDLLTDVKTNARNQLPDRWTGVPANRTIGLVLAGDDGRSAFRGFGHTAPATTFGHGGAAGQLAWADPTSGVSFAFCTNGIDAHQLRQWRRSASLQSKAASAIKR